MRVPLETQSVNAPLEAFAQKRSRVAELALAVAPGELEFGDVTRRDEIIEGATAEEWDDLLASPERIEWVVGAAKDALANRRFGTASALFRALATAKHRESFPGGPLGWLEVFLQTVRLFRAVPSISASLLREALAIATEQGKVSDQGKLHVALALASLRDNQLEAAQRHLADAKEAAGACSGATRAEIHVALAVGLLLQGRPRDGVATFEELLGDVPEDVGDLIEATSSSPATGLLMIALAYALTGQVPRALELVHRIRSSGQQHAAPAIDHEADVFEALVHEEGGDLEAARRCAERAHAFYSTSHSDPLHLWFSAALLARVSEWEGRHDEIAALVAEGLGARRESGWRGRGPGALLFALVERLEIERIQVPGFDLDGEIESALSSSSIFMSGAAHRYRARQLARRGSGNHREAIRTHLIQSVALLRQAGAGRELARALADAKEAGLGEILGREEVMPVLESGARGDRVGRILVELGRLGSLVTRHECVWGEIAARLCRILAAERCAIVEAGDAPRLLGVRGGSSAWRDAILAGLRGHAPRPGGCSSAPSNAPRSVVATHQRPNRRAVW